MYTVVLLLFSASVRSALCQCESTGGSWVNDKKSELHLVHKGDNLSGTFEVHTRLKEHEADNVKSAAVSGVYTHVGLVAYTIHFNKSVVAFVGQCFKEDNEDVMKVTWLLKTKADSSNNYWMTTRVGEDIFKRNHTTREQNGTEEGDGPDGSGGNDTATEERGRNDTATEERGPNGKVTEETGGNGKLVKQSGYRGRKHTVNKEASRMHIMSGEKGWKHRMNKKSGRIY